MSLYSASGEYGGLSTTKQASRQPRKSVLYSSAGETGVCSEASFGMSAWVCDGRGNKTFTCAQAWVCRTAAGTLAWDVLE